MKTSRIYTPLNAVTATTESSAINVQYAKKITFLFTRADNAGGTSTFSATGSVDGTTFVDLLLVTNVANSNAQTVTRATTAAIAAANGSLLASLDLDYLGLTDIKVKVTETTDGTHSASIYIEE